MPQIKNQHWFFFCTRFSTSNCDAVVGADTTLSALVHFIEHHFTVEFCIIHVFLSTCGFLSQTWSQAAVRIYRDHVSVFASDSLHYLVLEISPLPFYCHKGILDIGPVERMVTLNLTYYKALCRQEKNAISSPSCCCGNMKIIQFTCSSTPTITPPSVLPTFPHRPFLRSWNVLHFAKERQHFPKDVFVAFGLPLLWWLWKGFFPKCISADLRWQEP